MKTTITFLFVAIIFALSSCGNKAKVEQIHNGVKIVNNDINLKVQFYSPSAVRVQKWTSDGSDKKQSLIIVADSTKDVNIALEQKDNIVSLKSDKLSVEINTDNATIEYIDLQGKSILKETAHEFKQMIFHADTAFSVKQTFAISSDEAIYGLGQHQHGYMNLRGKKIMLAQSNTDAVSPVYISTKGYMITIDNYSKVIFEDDGITQQSFFCDVADNIDYYFTYGATMDEAIAGYRYLTGSAPMYGKWAYGYWQSKEHYDTQDELLAVARKYRQLHIPIDNIVQDWDYWYGNENWGSMEWHPTIFPRPIEMINELHKKNFHLMVSIWPAIGPNTEFYKEMSKHEGYLYPSIGWAGFKYFDVYNPEARQMYWDYLNRGLVSTGVDAWWMDSTEPDVINAVTKESSEYELKKMNDNYLGTFARYLNPFSLIMVGNVYDHWRTSQPNRRAYILTRSVFAGQQRYAATTWSGDIGASWNVFRKQIAAGINHCMSGVPYWTFDIGAFVLSSYEGVFCNSVRDPAYQELYTRMFQFGAFCPIFRSHGSEVPREIWEFGEFTPTLIKFDNLRYRILPYIYSWAWKITNQGSTMMRSLAMDFNDDKNVYNIDDQYMFGKSMMICPVTDFQKYAPPLKSQNIPSVVFRTNDGQQGLRATYYTDNKYQNLALDTIVSEINEFWFTGRPYYATDSMYSIHYEGKFIPQESGEHQFHLICYDTKRIKINGKELKLSEGGVERYSEVINLEAGKEYDFICETENNSTGAARMILRWRNPSMFAEERIPTNNRPTTRNVYLPKGKQWFDFWTGKQYTGGQAITADANIETMPIFVPSGSIIPMGPFVEYVTEKLPDPLEIRIYIGTNGQFQLYEDENDNYNYENGAFSTIDFNWNNTEKKLTIGKRHGSFDGMLIERTFNIVLVTEGFGNGLDICKKPTQCVKYNGEEISVKF